MKGYLWKIRKHKASVPCIRMYSATKRQAEYGSKNKENVLVYIGRKSRCGVNIKDSLIQKINGMGLQELWSFSSLSFCNIILDLAPLHGYKMTAPNSKTYLIFCPYSWEKYLPLWKKEIYRLTVTGPT